MQVDGGWGWGKFSCFSECFNTLLSRDKPRVFVSLPLNPYLILHVAWFWLKGYLKIQRWHIFFSRWNALNCYLNKYCYCPSKISIQVILSFEKKCNYQRQNLPLFVEKLNNFLLCFLLSGGLSNVQASVRKLGWTHQLWVHHYFSGWLVINKCIISSACV